MRNLHLQWVKTFKFFVVPGDRQALLGMSDTDTLNIININWNTIDTHGNDSANNCSTNTVICQGQEMCNTTQTWCRMLAGPESYANTDSISKFENKDKPTVYW